MRRFLLVTLILILLVSLAGAMTANVLLYSFYQQKASHLDLRGTRISNLDSQLGETQTQLRQAKQNNQALEDKNSSQQEQVATLQAQIANPPRPSPTPPTRPTVFVTAPISGSQFQQGDEVTIRWNAVNPDRIARVILEVDGRLVDETDAGGTSTAEGNFHWRAAGVGTHRLEVTAFNTLGGASAPAGVTIKVAPAAESQDDVHHNAAIMDTIEQQVVVLRGLEPLRPVTHTLYTHNELAQFIIEEMDKDFSPQEARNATLEMAAFDFIPANTDLRALMETLYRES